MAQKLCNKGQHTSPVIIILYLLFSPWFYTLSKYKESNHYRRRIDKSRADPPKPKRRKRALTVPQGERSLFSRKVETADQHNSSLMNLPVEVRVLIWGEYMGFEDDVYLLFNRRRLNSIRGGQTEWEGDVRKTVVDFEDGISIPYQQEKKVDILSLLKTCRTM